MDKISPTHKVFTSIKDWHANGGSEIEQLQIIQQDENNLLGALSLQDIPIKTAEFDLSPYFDPAELPENYEIQIAFDTVNQYRYVKLFNKNLRVGCLLKLNVDNSIVEKIDYWLLRDNIGDPQKEYCIKNEGGIAVGSDGSIYLTGIAEVNRYDGTIINDHLVLRLVTTGWIYAVWNQQLENVGGITISQENSSDVMFIVDKPNNRLLKFNSQGKQLPSPTSPFELHGIPLKYSLKKITDVAVNSSGFIYVNDEQKGNILKFNADGRFIEVLHRQKKTFRKPVAVTCDSRDNIYVLDGIIKQVFKFDAVGRYMGLSDFRDAVLSLPVTIEAMGSQLIFMADIVNKKIYELALEQKYNEDGSYLSEIINSEIEKCKWNSITLEAETFDGTNITLEARTSAIRTEVESTAWSKILDTSQLSNLSKEQNISIYKSLFLNDNGKSAIGRYLQLRILLQGTGIVSPSVYRLILNYPRQDVLLNYLPETYQSDPASSEFLSRFLVSFEESLMGIEEQIDYVDKYFNPDTAPVGDEDFISYLAGWVALTFDDNWPQEKKRALLERIVELYGWRGTKYGLEQYIQIYTGYRPRIVENFTQRNDGMVIGYLSTLGTDSTIGGEKDIGDTYTFTVYVRSHAQIPTGECYYNQSEKKAVDEKILRNIIDTEKPAHTDYDLIVTAPWMQIGVNSTIEMDTIIGPETGYLNFMQIGKYSTIECNTLIGGPTLIGMQIGIHSTFGLDTIIRDKINYFITG